MNRAVAGAAFLALACALLAGAGPATSSASRPRGGLGGPTQQNNPSLPFTPAPGPDTVFDWMHGAVHWIGPPPSPNYRAYGSEDGVPPYAFFFSPPKSDTFQWLQPPRPNWQAWWEANRDAFLAIDDQSRHGEPDQAPSEEPRKQAMAALVATLHSNVPERRAAAALALGKIGERSTFEPMRQLALNDPVLDVRLTAIIAIGLLDTPTGEAFLVTTDFKGKPMEHQAALIALGLMSQVDHKNVEGLQKRLQAGLGEPRRVSDVAGWRVIGRVGVVGWAVPAWALAQRMDPADAASRIRFEEQKIDRTTDLYRSHGYGPFTPPASDVQVGFVEGSYLAASAISCLGLSERVNSANAELLQNVLACTNMPWIASAAMLSLGHQGNPKSAPALAAVLLNTQEAQALPVFRLLQDQNSRLMYLWNVRDAGRDAYRGAINGAYGYWAYSQPQEYTADDDHPDYAWLSEWGAAPNGPTARAFIWHVFLRVEPAYAAHVRASAAAALGMVDCPAARQALEKALQEKDDEYSDIYKSAAIISLGQLGDAGAMETLAQLVHPMHSPGVLGSRKERESPLRGFAAIALGLYSRPATTPTGPADRPDYERLAPILAERLADASEPQEFRAACALALGLSGRTENLKYLQAISASLGQRDEIPAGYVILARGMLGDRNVMDLAKAYLASTSGRTGLPVIVGRRAAVLGLGLLGLREAVPIIESCWGANPAVNRETALALSITQAYGSAGRLVALMEHAPRPDDRVLAARCLGELLTKVRPQRLCRLLSGQNILMNTSRLVPYRAMANEFLFTDLRSTFQEQWRSNP